MRVVKKRSGEFYKAGAAAVALLAWFSGSSLFAADAPLPLPPLPGVEKAGGDIPLPPLPPVGGAESKSKDSTSPEAGIFPENIKSAIEKNEEAEEAPVSIAKIVDEAAAPAKTTDKQAEEVTIPALPEATPVAEENGLKKIVENTGKEAPKAVEAISAPDQIKEPGADTLPPLAIPELPSMPKIEANGAEPALPPLTIPEPARPEAEEGVVGKISSGEEMAVPAPPLPEIEKVEPKPEPKKAKQPKVVDYKTQRLPEMIYRKSYDKENRHLPVAQFESDYDAMLFSAVAHNDLNALRAVLNTNRNLEVQDSDGNSPFLIAVKSGNYAMANLLIRHGANPSIADNEGLTALHIAAWNGNRGFVSLLLSAKADVNAMDGSGRTPLILAAEGGHTDIVSVLLDKGAGVNVADNSGQTALHKAVLAQNAVIVSQLLSHGALTDIKDVQGNTAPMLAQHIGNQDVIAQLPVLLAPESASPASGGMPAVGSSEPGAPKLLPGSAGY